jgi:hypothetical protein
MTALMNHVALYSALKNNAALAAKISGIYDMPPTTAAFPYAEVGEVFEVSDELLDNSGAEITLRLHIWSKYAGRKEIYEIRALVIAALPEWALYDGINVMRDPDEPDIWHGIIEIKYFDRRN